MTKTKDKSKKSKEAKPKKPKKEPITLEQIEASWAQHAKLNRHYVIHYAAMKPYSLPAIGGKAIEIPGEDAHSIEINAFDDEEAISYAFRLGCGLLEKLIAVEDGVERNVPFEEDDDDGWGNEEEEEEWIDD